MAPAIEEVNNLPIDELIIYMEKMRSNFRKNSKKHYDETVKQNPEKYQKFLEKCNRNNKAFQERKKLEKSIIKTL